MKRILSMLLAVLLVATSLVTLSACARPQDVDFTGYKLVYAKDASASLSEKIKSFADTLADTVDTKIKLASVAADAEIEDGEELEILVGNTNRPETAKALKKIKGHGYIITVINNKVVIVGTTNLLTGVALDTFVTTYCAEQAASTTLSISKTEVENMSVVTLSRDWKFVYSDRMDDSSSDAVKPERQDPENTLGYDYGYLACKQIKESVATATGLKALQYGEYSDATEKAVDAVGEIIVGTTTRAQSVEFVNSLGDVDRYGISVKADSIVIAGVNDIGLRAATEYFKDLVLDAAYVDEDENKLAVLPLDFVAIDTLQHEWVTDFPKPEGEGILLSGSTDVADNAVEYYYTGDGVSAAAYNTYCATLETAGYTRYMEHTAEDSIFRTYVNSTANITLNVTYCAYKHAEAQGVTFYQPAIRIVSASLLDDRINLIPEELLTMQSGYTRVGDTSITAVKLAYSDDSYGNCYILTLEDGSFVVYDSGFSNTGNQANLEDALKTLHRQVTGAEPSANNPYRIKAWYITHGHGDHYANFYSFSRTNAGMIQLEYLITNFPSDSQTYNCYDPNLTLRNNLDDYVKKLGDTTYLKLHSGQVFWLGNVQFEVLYTHEDIYPQMIHRYNDSSVAIRTTVYNTDGLGNVTPGSNTLTTLWLGDTQTGGSACMRAMYGSYLKSDQVQIAHHGGNGCEWELYQLVEATCVWYPHKVEAYENVITNGPKAQAGTSTYISYKTVTMSSVKYIIISDGFNTTLTVDRNGAVYGLAKDTANGLTNASASAAVVPIYYGKYVIKR